FFRVVILPQFSNLYCPAQIISKFCPKFVMLHGITNCKNIDFPMIWPKNIVLHIINANRYYSPSLRICWGSETNHVINRQSNYRILMIFGEAKMKDLEKYKKRQSKPTSMC